MFCARKEKLRESGGNAVCIEIRSTMALGLLGNWCVSCHHLSITNIIAISAHLLIGRTSDGTTPDITFGDGATVHKAKSECQKQTMPSIRVPVIDDQKHTIQTLSPSSPSTSSSSPSSLDDATEEYLEFWDGFLEWVGIITCRIPAYVNTYLTKHHHHHPLLSPTINVIPSPHHRFL